MPTFALNFSRPGAQVVAQRQPAPQHDAESGAAFAH